MPPSLSPDDLYGDRPAQLLRGFHDHAAAAATGVVSQFYESLLGEEALRPLLHALDESEFTRLQDAQARHLTMLVSPGLGRAEHHARAVRVGRVHALVGLDIMWLTGAYSLYQDELHRLLDADASVDAEHGQQLLQLIDRRLLADLREQSVGYHEIELELATAIGTIQQQALRAGSLVDLYQSTLRTFCGIDGLIGAFVGRLGRQRCVEIEAVDGAAAQAYLAAVQRGELPPLRIDDPHAADDTRGGDAAPEPPASRSWRTGEIGTTRSYALEASLRPWSSVGKVLGFRSSATMPLIDEAGHTFAMINLYSRWPGFFDARGRRLLLEQLQQVLSASAARHVQGSVVSYADRRTYGAWLDARRVRMLYQPIVELRTGRLLKVEALARLVDDAGGLVGPASFLPTLSNQGLFRLFETGVEQACRDHARWTAQGVDAAVSVNIPPAAVGDLRYHDALFGALERFELPAGALQLEILESAATQEHAERRRFFEQLLRHGVRVVLDDLGSGHSSLLRLDSMPFDELKIDQGLVLSAARKDPERAFAFILYLTQLAHALKLSVTVEGLENPGLIEAAAILGADHGQGYAIARPMPAQQLAQWQSGYRHPVDRLDPRTPWGALASYLLWDRQLRALAPWPQLVEEFVGSRCGVQSYLERSAMCGSPLHLLLQRNHALAMHPAMRRLYERSRRRLVDALGAMDAVG